MANYRTVQGYGEAQIEEKKSKFIGYVSPAETEDAAAAFIQSIKKKHYNATHNCFAYSIGLKEEFVKANDDGEPSGTAGMPILDILRREQIHNCVIVVTRYFGGTLLGTGGLVRAYSKAAKEGLLAAGIIERIRCTKYQLTVDYHTLGKVQYEMEKAAYRVLDTAYTDAVTITALIEYERREAFIKDTGRWCQGQEKLEEMETDYFDL